MSRQMAVNVTFKDSEKWIYDEVMKHSSKGGFIKDVLAEHLRDKKKEKIEKPQENIQGINSILDSFEN